MSAIVVQTFLSLDGVMQAPGGPDEDPSGGFTRGGWQMEYDREHDPDDEGGALILDWESRTEALLLGRRTYQLFAGAWGVWDEDAPGLEGELTRRYNRVPKHVASRATIDLPWRNSEQLGPDLPAAVAAVKARTDGEVRVWGSGDLIRTLAAHDLIDEYRLVVYPIVLGGGQRLFGDGFPASTFALAESRALASGVVVSTYRREG